MSEITNRNMNTHINKVSGLKNQFTDKYKTSENEALDFIAQMRTIHGLALLDDANDKQNLIKNSLDNISQADLIKLSGNQSILHCIHNHIRNAEKLLYNHKQGNPQPNLLTSDSSLSPQPRIENGLIENPNIGSEKVESSFVNAINRTNQRNLQTISNNNVIATVRPTDSGTDELSIQNIITETDENNNIQKSDIFTETKIDDNVVLSNKPAYNNTSDFINNLETSDLGHLFSEYEKDLKRIQNGIKTHNLPNQNRKSLTNDLNSSLTNDLTNDQAQININVHPYSQKGGMNTDNDQDINKPTIINYWADWCGPSRNFKPKWDDFKEKAKSKFPNLQIKDLNISNKKELSALAAKAGVTSFPTIVLYNNGIKHSKPAGNMTSEKLHEFVDRVINNKQ